MGAASGERRDIRDRDDLAALIGAFYRRAFADPLIGPIFTDVAHMDLDHHLPIMCDFWETVLFDTGAYRRNALALHVAMHAKASLGAPEFDRWLELWNAEVDARFAGPTAGRAKTQAQRIAASIRRRLEGGSGSMHETITTRERLEAAGMIDAPDGSGADAERLSRRRAGCVSR
ncbi:group III truncated hemoglobin [Agromyces sp. S2-1-8]|uniref:group III truncated hemoglobin n=1 Tax=Agromyces sp. S2-1-8 TaxID=2897180 RepID=UPI001E333634|nr:group III truncated hemoglobin [Agromyces sp. S2-1-8]MCD5346787.1 group III truncated hemoglobin [Agromyces sp. S2-1-8]